MMRWKIWCMNNSDNLDAGWSVSNGITSYTAQTEQEANWLKDQLNRVSESAEPPKEDDDTITLEQAARMVYLEWLRGKHCDYL